MYSGRRAGIPPASMVLTCQYCPENVRRTHHGTGTDIWFSARGILAEEREIRDEKRHGYERWWNDDNRTVHEEGHYWNGVEHGIFRRWNFKGRLRRGYPQYFIMGKRVAKRQYLRAYLQDLTLPPFIATDNDPTRPLPVEAMKMSEQLIRDQH